MRRWLLLVATLGGTLAVAACDVTGTAPPASAYYHEDGNQIGSPGFGAP